MRNFFVNNWIVITIGAALIASLLVAIRNKQIIEENSALQKESAQVIELTKEILSGSMHGLDIGLRGFALTRDEKMLEPYKKAIDTNASTFRDLEAILSRQGYDKLADLQGVKIEVDAYVAFCNKMIETTRMDSLAHVIEMLREDRGYGVWKKYDAFSKPLFAFEENINQKALATYNAAIRGNLILQVCMVLLALPALILFMRRITKEREARQALLMEVEQNDRKFVFDAGTERSIDAHVVINTSIKNIRTASDFIKAMALENYDVKWEGLNDGNQHLNKETLAGNLLDMREKLKLVKREDDERNWANEGLARFSEIVRNNQSNSQELADRCVSFLTKYLNAQQCSLFVLEGEEPDKYLMLTSCYAFDKKKFVEKRIDIGSGLVGQTFLEGEILQLKDIPQGYIKITSGLGDSTPAHLIIVPLKYDVHTVAVIEIASFSFFEGYQVTFLQKAGEFLASAILNSQTTFKMKNLLEQATINEENMRQREEEMRQNMEELQATQEELMRQRSYVG